MENKEMIQRTVDYIEDNLENPLRLDDIAKEAGYSKFHLNRVFLACVGCTIYKYIQMRRLTVAAEKLVCTQKPIIEIAYEACYSSQQSFAFAFRQLYGHPPQVYRASRVHVPKFKKYELESSLVVLCRPAMKCEVIAA